MIKQNRLSVRTAAIVAAAVAPLGAFAQAVDPFNTAVTDITSKVTSYGGALVGLSAVGVVFWVAIKYVKKIRGAA